jgi:hypothetical protein
MSHLILNKLLAFSSVTSVTLMLQSSTALAQAWKMPWPSNISAPVTQTAHGEGSRAFDIGLSANTPVLAPVDSTVVSSCIAQYSNNHRAIKLRASNGQIYSLIHVRASSLKNSYKQGEQIGVDAADLPSDSRCAVSRGIHLHMGFPTLPFTIDGQTLSTSTRFGTILRSSNSPTNLLTFAPGASSSLRISRSALDLTITASNLAGKRVYLQMWRAAAYGYPERTWNLSTTASSNTLAFRDIDGSGDTFTGVSYYTVASLNPIPANTAKQRRTACYSATGGQQLCDVARR